MNITKENYKRKIKEVLISSEQVKERIVDAAKYIESFYNDKPLVIITILKGSVIFASDLVREIDVPCELAFMRAKSYCSGVESSGNVKISVDCDIDIEGREVIVIEDIVDTGRTLAELVKILGKRNPSVLKVVTLLDKPSRRVLDFAADFSLFTVPDEFVIGYGLDCDEYYRNLPYIAVYDPEA